MNRQSIKVRVDNYTRACLTGIAVLLTIVILGLWSEVKVADRALAADPVFTGGTGQRQEVVEAIGETNKRLDTLIDLFKSGQVKVLTTPADAGDANATQGKGK